MKKRIQANDMRVSRRWWLLQLSAKVLALLRLSVNVFQLRLTKTLKNNFHSFKEFNINKPVFFGIFKVARLDFLGLIPSNFEH